MQYFCTYKPQSEIFLIRHNSTNFLQSICYNSVMGAINMLLDLLIKINKINLNYMISSNKKYELIVAQSQKLDKYITKKTIILINKHKNKKT